MKPYQSSSDKENCSPISSNCVIWQGPNISCINLCKGDSVSDIVYKLAVELCDIQTNTVLTEPNGVSLLQLDCLLQLCGAKTVPADKVKTTAFVLQLIIDKICCTYDELNTAITELQIFTGYNVNGNTGGTGSTAGRPGGSSEPMLDLPPCLYYNDPFTGLQVTTLELTPYVVHLANSFCTLQATVEEHTSQITVLEGKVTVLETAPCCYTTPVIIPNCTYGSVYDGVSTQIDNVVNSLSTEYCALRNTLGTNTQLVTAQNSQCAFLSSSQALGQSGTMSSISGWNNTINTFAQSMQNLWLTVCDMRTAVNSIKQNITPDCSKFLLGFINVTNTERTTVTLIFNTYTFIPDGFDNCPTLSTVSITDGANTYTNTLDLVAYANDPDGITYTISGEGTVGLNPALPYTITVTGCLISNGTTCSKQISNTNSPTTTTTSTTTAAPCNLFQISISNVDIEASVDGIVYVVFEQCETFGPTVIAYTSDVSNNICVKPGYIPTLYYFAPPLVYTVCDGTNSSFISLNTSCGL
jgi:hypothetical protein